MADEGTVLNATDTPAVDPAAEVMPVEEQPLTETPADDAGNTPVVEETPEERASRLELELAKTQGALEEARKTEEPVVEDIPTPEEKALADIDTELGKIDEQLASEDVQPSAYDDDDAKAEKREKRLALKEQRIDLVTNRVKAVAEVEARQREEAKGIQALGSMLGQALKDRELPDSLGNALTIRVSERMAKLGYVSRADGRPAVNAAGQPISGELFAEIVNGQASELARLQAPGTPRPKPRTAPPVNGGGRNAPANTGEKAIRTGALGTPANVIADMRKAGIFKR